jgi:hypothetical protein
LVKFYVLFLTLISTVRQVKLRNDMPDDMLRDAIETSRRVLESVSDFETQGLAFSCRKHNM